MYFSSRCIWHIVLLAHTICMILFEQSLAYNIFRDFYLPRRHSAKKAPKQKAKSEKTKTYFEGDIILTEKQKRFLMASRSHGNRFKRRLIMEDLEIGGVVQTWPQGLVVYEMSPDLDVTYQRMFRAAMNIIGKETCVRFVPRTQETIYVKLEKNEGACLSHLGYTGKFQKVVMADICASLGGALHELGHTLGLWHEHSRPDRDRYIEILPKNLRQPNDVEHFRKISREIFNSVPDVGYDLESIMHYSPYAFAKHSNGGLDLHTIRIRENVDLEELNCSNRLPMGQRVQLSYKDKKRLNLLYKCSNVRLNKEACVKPKDTKDKDTVAASADTPPSIEANLPKKESLLLFSMLIHNYCPKHVPSDGKLKTGSDVLISLNEVFHNAAVYDEHRMECTLIRGCYPTPCSGTPSTCKSITDIFEIAKIRSTGGVNIGSGDAVYLRSVRYKTRFLDCSSASECVLTECRESLNQRLPPAQCQRYTSTCPRHMFEIISISSSRNKHLDSSHNVVFRWKPVGDDFTSEDGSAESYLSCYGGVSCHLEKRTECPLSANFDSVSSSCLENTFKVIKLSDL